MPLDSSQYPRDADTQLYTTQRLTQWLPTALASDCIAGLSITVTDSEVTIMECFIVLGMHKSGTTLLSEMLHYSGISMVEELSSQGYYAGNKVERETTKKLNKQILKCGDKHSLDVVHPYKVQSDHATFVENARSISTSLSLKHDKWGFKDPRTCLTYPVWQDALPYIKLVCVFRSPQDVVVHYGQHKLKGTRHRRRILRAWTVYNNGLLEAYASLPKSQRIMINYNELMKDAREFQRLERFLGVRLMDRRQMPEKKTQKVVEPITALDGVQLALSEKLNYWLTLRTLRRHQRTEFASFKA